MMEMMEIKKISVLIIILMALFLQACGSSSASAVNETVTEDTKNTALTIMYYGDADNNLEPSLLEDIAEMKAGYSDAGYNLVTLFDRTPGYSSNFRCFWRKF